MEVVVAKKSGFCFGVKTAMGIVEEHKGEKDVCILGELIHNPDVIEKIEKKGIKSFFLRREYELLTSLSLSRRLIE